MDIYIRGINLPFRVNGVTVVDSDGNYNVYVNNQLGHNAQLKTFQHELNHIKRKHFEDFNPVIHNEIEADTRIIACNEIDVCYV